VSFSRNLYKAISQLLDPFQLEHLLVQVGILKNKLIEEKDQDPYLLFEEHFFIDVLVYRKSYDVHFEDLSNKDLEYF
jgi:hypothetical protein